MKDRKSYTVRLPLDVAQRFEDEAHRLRRSRGALLEAMITNCLDLLVFSPETVMVAKNSVSVDTATTKVISVVMTP